MRRSAIVLGLLIAFGACGDDNSPVAVDSSVGDGGVDAGSGQPPPPGTFTAFVTDLINTGTSDTTQPVAFDSFATLPDPDGDRNNTAAFDGLF